MIQLPSNSYISSSDASTFGKDALDKPAAVSSQSASSLSDSAQLSTSALQSRNTAARYEGSITDGNGRSVQVRASSTTVSLSQNTLSTATQNVYSPASVSTFSQNQAASNILKFIDAQLVADASAGATEESLESRLKAGLEGFLEGFSQAEDQLNALGDINPTLKSATQQTYDEVVGGIARLAAQYNIENPAKDLQTLGGSSLIATDSLASSLASTSLSASTSAIAAQQKGFEFALTTAEGDTVIIKAQSTQVSAYATSANQDGAQYASVIEGNDNRFVLEINGDLNQAELSSINQLLTDVSSLSQTFYSGDLSSAFDQALNLNIDAEQIVNFSLNLSLTNYTRVESNLAGLNSPSVSNAESPLSGAVDNRVAKMAEFIQQLEDIRLQGRSINIFENTLNKLFEITLENQPEHGANISQILNTLANRGEG